MSGYDCCINSADKSLPAAAEELWAPEAPASTAWGCWWWLHVMVCKQPSLGCAVEPQHCWAHAASGLPAHHTHCHALLLAEEMQQHQQSCTWCCIVRVLCCILSILQLYFRCVNLQCSSLGPAAGVCAACQLQISIIAEGGGCAFTADMLGCILLYITYQPAHNKEHKLTDIAHQLPMLALFCSLLLLS